MVKIKTYAIIYCEGPRGYIICATQMGEPLKPAHSKGASVKVLT